MEKYPNLQAALMVSADGVVCCFRENVGSLNMFTLPPVRANIVDFIGAADAFEGAFVARLLQGDSPSRAAIWAVHCGACSTTRHGAQSSMPTTDELAEFMVKKCNTDITKLPLDDPGFALKFGADIQKVCVQKITTHSVVCVCVCMYVCVCMCVFIMEKGRKIQKIEKK